MRVIRLTILASLLASTAAFAAPAPAVSFLASVAPGVALSSGIGSGTAPGAAVSAELGARIGGDRLAAMIRAGVVKHAASAYTDVWTRYRGFSGLSLAAGPNLRLGLFEFGVLAGGALARYDLSYSYFAFPYIEPGASYRAARLDDRFSLGIGLSLPVYLRADALSLGFRAVAELRYESPRQERPSTPSAESAP